jgi:hypothetical protein
MAHSAFSSLRLGIWTAFVLVCCVGCSRRADAPAPQVAATAASETKGVTPSPPPPAAPAPPPPPAAAPAAPSPYDRPGWTKIELEDNVPICVFANDEERVLARFIEQVRKQSLPAEHAVTFGAYAPTCMNPTCDDYESLQCWVERAGDKLTVHTRYSDLHKDGTKCTTDCRIVTAGCDSPALQAGTYTVQHGDRTFKLKIPGTLKQPCLVP